MPKRLVYSPRCYAFVKGPDNNITNISEYVVSGEVQRLISQASTAELTLRNPQRIFTTPTRKVYFHPMDPITIYMERLRGYPVQVFTGYLDDTPYYQLFPGTVTLQATCTLKRLIYTYFDPSLPYVNQFLAKYGWVNFFDGTARNYNALVKSPTTVKENNPLNDSSIGKLLWAILTDIGEWDDTNIWIEELPGGPNGIAARITKLYNSLIASEQTAGDQFSAFLQQMIGNGSQGSGGGNGGSTSSGTVNTSNIANQQQWATSLLQTLGVPTNNTNLQCIVGWEQAEANSSIWGTGQADDPEQTHNPLNTTETQGESGTVGQGIGVYPDWNTGIQATVTTLQGYPAVLSALKSADSTTKFVNAVGSSGWGTNGALLAQTVAGTKITSNTTSDTGSGTTTTTDGIGGAAAPTTSTGTSGSQMSAIDAMIRGATMINNSKLPYVYAGGHQQCGTPSIGSPGNGYDGHTIGFDCSGCVSAVISAASGQLGFKPGQPVGSDFGTDGVISLLQSAGLITPGPGTGTPECTVYDSPGVHVFMSLNGVVFGTSHGEGGPTNPAPSGKGGGGGTWLTKGPDVSTFNAYHFSPSKLNETVTFTAPNVSGSAAGAPSGTSGGTTGGGGGQSQQQVISDSSAAAFTTELNFPSIADITEAMLLGSEHKGLMHDQQLMPFVQQVAQASLREFMSLPNGDFYAFYPDYFGETAHRVPYWKIPDLEILDGAIYLNDSALVTHQYVVGDNTYPVDDALINALFSSAAITVYNAFLDPSAVSIDIDNSDQNLPKGMADVMSQAEAVNFVKRYGARPQVSNYPMVRSALYEMFLAYQQFLLSWSNQFRTPFTFTFMPELFPGGKVAFPDHGLQMYINSVTHTWDLAEAGFTTSAVLSAPAKMPGTNNPDLPPNMVQALVEPVRTTASLNPTTGKPKNKSTQDQSTSNQQSTPVRTPAPPPPPGVTITSTGTF